jgi:hypothetical protein
MNSMGCERKRNGIQLSYDAQIIEHTFNNIYSGWERYKDAFLFNQNDSNDFWQQRKDKSSSSSFFFNLNFVNQKKI